MDKYECLMCGWIYDPEKGDPDGGIKPGTPFEKIPDNWMCPLCGVTKEDFVKVEKEFYKVNNINRGGCFDGHLYCFYFLVSGFSMTLLICSTRYE